MLRRLGELATGVWVSFYLDHFFSAWTFLMTYHFVQQKAKNLWSYNQTSKTMNTWNTFRNVYSVTTHHSKDQDTWTNHKLINIVACGFVCRAQLGVVNGKIWDSPRRRHPS